MARYAVQCTFKIVCVTRGIVIEAEDEDDAMEKLKSAIDADGQLDDEKLRELGFEDSWSWDTRDGTQHDFEIDEDHGAEIEDEF